MTDELSYIRCPACGHAAFPEHALPTCGHAGPGTSYSFTEEGQVYAWTRVHGAGGTTLLAMADFLDGEVRVTAPLVGTAEVSVGDRVRVRRGAELPYELVPSPA